MITSMPKLIIGLIDAATFVYNIYLIRDTLLHQAKFSDAATRALMGDNFVNGVIWRCRMFRAMFALSAIVVGALAVTLVRDALR